MEPHDKLHGDSDGKVWDIFRVIQSLCGKARIDEQVMMIILAVLIGAVTGGAAILFGFLIGWFHDLFIDKGYGLGKGLVWWGRYLLPLIPATGGLIVGLLVYFGAREAKGQRWDYPAPRRSDQIVRQRDMYRFRWFGWQGRPYSPDRFRPGQRYRPII